jgi:hypothetical protein
VLHQYKCGCFNSLAVVSASFAFADLRAPETFSSIANPAERSRALFRRARASASASVSLPSGHDRPLQGNASSHSPLVKGATAARRACAA